MANVTKLAEETGLTEHLHVLRQGALVAQDPDNFEAIDGEYALDEGQKDALHQEILHKWRVPKLLYLTIITCSIGAAVQGWDQEGSNGANLSFPLEFGIDGEDDRAVFLVGLINSAPYIGSAFIGCWISDPLNNYLGRKCELFFTILFIDAPIADTPQGPSSCQLLSACSHRSVVQSLRTGSNFWSRDFSWVLAWVSRHRLFPSSPPRTVRLLSEEPLSCAGKCGLHSVFSWESAPILRSAKSPTLRGGVGIVGLEGFASG